MHTAKKNIVLIGYRATGKSVVGIEVAKRLGLDFMDMDKEIETRQNATIQQMVDELGWEYFRNWERRLLQELAGRENRQACNYLLRFCP